MKPYNNRISKEVSIRELSKFFAPICGSHKLAKKIISGATDQMREYMFVEYMINGGIKE